MTAKKNNTVQQLRSLLNNPQEALVIHYSRQNLNDNERGMATPRIIAILIKSLDGITTNCFAIHHEAEKAKVILENITDYYDLLEANLIKGFNNFIKQNPGRKWIHWDMNDVHFSFEAIEHRYKVLVEESGAGYVQVPNNDRINLNQVIKAIYSSNYEKDPQLDNLMRTNNVGQLRDGFLTLPQEAQAFRELGFPSILESLRCKVNFLLEVIEKAANDTLKVGKRNRINRLRAFITHPVTATVSLFLTLLSLIVKIISILGK
jgi:hypothetical protein